MKLSNRMQEKVNQLLRNLPPKYYEMPRRYRDSFYLANASLFDSVNWYLHKGYENVFPELVEKLMQVSNFTEEQASKRISNIIQVCDQCDHLVDIRYPLKRENNSLDLIRCFRVGHGSFTGFPLAIGGLRISPNITRDDMKGLGVLSSHRLAAMDIKACGAFGAIKIDSDQYSSGDLKEIVSQYTSKCLMENANHTNFLIEPDLNCGDRLLSWINERKGETFSPYFNNNWLDNVASLGAFVAMEYFLQSDAVTSKLKLGKGISGKTYILQGLGKMGSNLAVLLQSAGAICVGVKEHDSHVFNKDGFDIQEIISHKKKTGSIIGFQLAKPTDDLELYKEECDILILAAKQKSIACHMAKEVKAKLIVEAAYMPITPSASMILRGLSKIILPDIFICGGSAIALYLDYCLKQWDKGLVVNTNILDGIPSNLLNNSMKALAYNVATTDGYRAGEQEDVLQHVIKHTFNKKAQGIMDTCEKYNLGYDFKTAAFVISIKNIFDEIFSTNKY